MSLGQDRGTGAPAPVTSADTPPAVVDETIEPDRPEAPGVPVDRTTGRIPTLDGLRAISIMAVVIGHLAGTNGFPPQATAIIANRYVDVSYLGVRVFFVISGFLITGILINEHRRSGGISLKRFYLRRSVRIFPAYYTYIVALILLTWLGIASVTTSDVAHAVTYTMNYDTDRSWDVGHLWSLAVEEQFYLLWPVTIILLGLRWGGRAALAVVLLAPVFRAIEYWFLPGMRPLIGNTFETTADAIAMGCILALTIDELVKRSWFQRIIASRWMILALLFVALGLSIRSDTDVVIGHSLTNLAVALIIARCVLRPHGVLGRILETRPLVMIGVLSYSIYLWQQLFLNRTTDQIITTFPLNIILAAVAAVASYVLVERPWLRRRPRIEARWLGKPTQPIPAPAPTRPA